MTALEHSLAGDGGALRDGLRSVGYELHLPSKKEQEIVVTYTHTHAMVPLPGEIAQYETQRVVYSLASRLVDTPYDTETQTTRVVLASHHVENLAQLEPVSQHGNELQFGPYENGEASTSSPLRIHFENHAPAIVYTSVRREVLVPHPDGNSLFRWLHWRTWFGAMRNGRDGNPHGQHTQARGADSREGSPGWSTSRKCSDAKSRQGT